MRRYSGAVVLLGLTVWAEPAGAQDVAPKSYSLTVSVHPAVNPKLQQSEIENILRCASGILQGNTTIVPLNCPLMEPHNNCQIEFKFKGFQPFVPAAATKKTVDDLANIEDADGLEAVHSVPADVKVVESITFCAPGVKPTGYAGCAWRPAGSDGSEKQRTVIVARSKFLPMLGPAVGAAIWAHEFGHTTGLVHRYQRDDVSGDSANLMTPCDLGVLSQPINNDECAQFRAGRMPPPYPPLGPTCPRPD